MRVSAKGRYALAAVIEMARQSGKNENVSAINISKSLGISKVYLEQALGDLKNNGLLMSAKGSYGGYRLSRQPERISAWDILIILESALSEKAESTVAANSPAIEEALKTLVFEKLDGAIKNDLEQITIRELLDYSERQRTEQAYMLHM